MPTHRLGLRSGMTLVELLVVVAIIGLLAVTVSPLFQARSDRRKFADAGALVATHFNSVVARSIGSGAGAWLRVDTGLPAAVTVPGVTRMRAASGQLAVMNMINSGTATVSLSPAPLILNGLVRVAGLPTPFRLGDSAGSPELSFVPGYSPDNAAFPAIGGTYQFKAVIPPQERVTAGSRPLPGGFCIDFSASTIGVHGYTPPSEIVPLVAKETVAVMFDATGRATLAWTFAPTDSPQWQWHQLDNRRPMALLVGRATQTGVTPVLNPTEDDPGPNVQNPDAVWVLIDPRAALARTVANRAIPETPIAIPLLHAQGYVAEALTNVDNRQ
jgi:prepilin-type N-terminal cleavage/methylation domain-containing protein